MAINRHTPYGYFMIHGNIQIHEIYSEIVKRIFRNYINGISQKQIAKNLTSEGIKTPTGKNVWSHAAVRAILTNVKYTGDRYHPALISDEDFKKAVEIRDARNHEIRKCMTKKKISNCYSGKLICAKCNAPYTKKRIYPKGKKGIPKAYWICRNYISENKRSCDNLIIAENDLDYSFIRILKAIKKDQSLICIKDNYEINTNFEINKLSVNIENEIKHHKLSRHEFQEMVLKRARCKYEISLNHNREYLYEKIVKEIMATSTDVFNEELFESIVQEIKIVDTGEIHYTFINGAVITDRIGDDLYG